MSVPGATGVESTATLFYPDENPAAIPAQSQRKITVPKLPCEFVKPSPNRSFSLLYSKGGGAAQSVPIQLHWMCLISDTTFTPCWK